MDEFLSDQEQDFALLQELFEKPKFVAVSSQPWLYTVGLGLRPSACLRPR